MRSSRRTITLLPELLVVLYLLSTSIMAGPIQPAMPGQSPKAEDLSRVLIATTRSTTKKLTFETLDNSMDVMDRILSSYARRLGDPDVLSAGGRADKAQISANRKLVSRKGNLLVIGRPKGKQFQFRDGPAPGGYRREGTRDTFAYAGPLGTSGYHKVDAFSEHNARGFYLLNPENSAALFVHSESDLVSISTDQKNLMVMNHGLTSPFSLLVAVFDEHGVKIDLHCQSHVDGGIRQRIIPFFKGWHRTSKAGFDVVLLVQKLDDDPTPRFEAIPVRFNLKDSEWHVFVPDPQRFTRSTKVTCWQ